MKPIRLLPFDRRSTLHFDRAVQRTLISSRRRPASSGLGSMSRAQAVAHVLGLYRPIEPAAPEPSKVEKMFGFLARTVDRVLGPFARRRLLRTRIAGPRSIALVAADAIPAHA